MQCLHPVKIKNPSNDNEYCKSNPYLLVPCGKCESCIVSSANEWRVRLQIENKYSNTSFFVTLTYNDDKVPLSVCSDSFGEKFIVPVVCKRDVQLFFKRLRKSVYPAEVRYYLVSEYCPTSLRPHYHCLLFGLPIFNYDKMLQNKKVYELIEKCWNNGFVTIDPVTDGRIAYVTKYLSCTIDLPEYLPKPFRLMSRRPGIGNIYLDNKDLVNYHRENVVDFISFGKFKYRMPRYLRGKVFDDDMLCYLRDKSIQYRYEKDKKVFNLSRFLGYKGCVPFTQEKIDFFIKKFNERYNKSRKIR